MSSHPENSSFKIFFMTSQINECYYLNILYATNENECYYLNILHVPNENMRKNKNLR